MVYIGLLQHSKFIVFFIASTTYILLHPALDNSTEPMKRGDAASPRATALGLFFEGCVRAYLHTHVMGRCIYFFDTLQEFLIFLVTVSGG
jgi:hypothetical protein